MIIEEIQRISDSVITEEIARVCGLIRAAAKEGKYNVSILSINENTRIYFKRSKFKVTSDYTGAFGPITYTISWDGL